MSKTSDDVLELLMKFAQLDLPVRALELPRNRFLAAAHGFGVEQPGEKLRPFMTPLESGICGGAIVACVQVGAEFQIHGPGGPVTIREIP